jgi:hypothetical protein
MKEKLVEFKTAKLAKEKGFNVEYTSCQMFYITDEEGINYLEDKPRRTPFEHHTYILSPTQSLLQKWLREKHKIYVDTNHSRVNDDEEVTLHQSNITIVSCIHSYNFKWIKESSDCYGETYEEALEKGLYEALKLIKN